MTHRIGAGFPRTPHRCSVFVRHAGGGFWHTIGHPGALCAVFPQLGRDPASHPLEFRRLCDSFGLCSVLSSSVGVFISRPLFEK